MDSYIGKSLMEMELKWNNPAQEGWELLAEFKGHSFIITEILNVITVK